MGLIEQNQDPDRRPRDWAYIATFREKDLPSLQDMIKRINATHDTGLIQEFNKKCEQKAAENRDHNISIEGITIQTVTKSDDLILTGGLRHCINIILGLSSARWSHFGMSPQGDPPATISDSALNTENVATRVSLAWSEPVGMRLFFGGISSQSSGLRPGTVKEIGVYNGSAAGAILLNRSTFSANYPSQSIAGITDISSAPIVVSAVIEFCPIA